MKILRFDRSHAQRIGRRPFEVRDVSELHVAEGAGDAHAYLLYFDPGGLIGPHEAGFGQLFVAVSGHGWVAGPDGARQALAQGEAAFIARGEVHAKGSDSGLVALMVQVRDLSV
jgi:quercetin dioxygenase-like cupin family protein